MILGGPVGAAEVELLGIGKSFGEFQLLRDFNLALWPGEFVTAIGSSGCGKTTVLKLMNGLVRPDAGTVLFRGENIAGADRDGLRRRMGYVIQGVGLFPHMRVRDNIAYVPRLEGVDEGWLRRRVRELLEMVRLDESLLERYPRELSGGQRQRVGLARALAANPPLLLMDEPFGAVDDITRGELQGEMRRIHAELGMTVFFITHDIAEAFALGDRVIVMDKGRIVQDGSPEDIRLRPDNEFVERLVGRRQCEAPVRN